MVHSPIRPQNPPLVSGPMRLLSSTHTPAASGLLTDDCSMPSVAGVEVVGGAAHLVGGQDPEPVDTVTQVRARNGGAP